MNVLLTCEIEFHNEKLVLCSLLILHQLVVCRSHSFTDLPCVIDWPYPPLFDFLENLRVLDTSHILEGKLNARNLLITHKNELLLTVFLQHHTVSLFISIVISPIFMVYWYKKRIMSFYSPMFLLGMVKRYYWDHYYDQNFISY